MLIGGSIESAPPTPTTTLTQEELMQAMGKMDSKIISTKAMEVPYTIDGKKSNKLTAVLL